jgi:lysozyme
VSPRDDIFIECLVQIKQDEGFRNSAYVCPAGALTIGYGRNIDTGGAGITEAEGQVLLANDITACDDDLRGLFRNWDSLSARVRATLINLRFQLGPSRFRAFRKMIAAIQNGDFVEAARQLRDSNLARQTPGRTLRRAAELEQG